MGPPTLFTIPVLRYMKTYSQTHEQLAMVSVVQREWAAKSPCAIPRRKTLAGRPGEVDHRRGCAELRPLPSCARTQSSLKTLLPYFVIS